ncbi:MAG: hypothetical protein LBQ83_03040, partial [Candidatus Margulisbacteria bacterium]|nr:hypothetical protein [Candidatus Margulisiibacteriota bacterium]
GADWITTIEAFDGEYVLQNGHWVESVSRNGDMANIFTGIAGLGLDVGYMLQKIPRSKRGQAIDGYPKDVFDTLMYNSWFIDNEELYVMGENQVLGDMVYRLDSAQLLATPRKRDRILECSTLFFPQLRIGRIIELETTVKQYNGQYQVAEFTHDVMISGAESGTAMTKMSLFIGKYAWEPVLVGGSV